MSSGTTATSPVSALSNAGVSNAAASASNAAESVPAEASLDVAEGPGADGDAKVHAVDTFSRGAMQWGYFLLLNAIAGSVAVAFFIAVFYADGLDPYLMGTYEWLLGHPGVTSALAFSPLACSLLVGYGYASRARKRKKLAAERELKAKAQSSDEQRAAA